MCSATDGSDSPTPAPLEQLERQICELAADLAAATARWLELIAEFDARAGWAEWGVSSCAHWLSWRLGIGLRTGREHVRVARSLGALPLIAASFRTGELSYSKVRALTRVAQPETEADLLDLGRRATGAQIERLVSGYAGVIRVNTGRNQELAERVGLSWSWGEDGMLHLDGRLSPEDGARLLAALKPLEAEADREEPLSRRRAQALVALADGAQTPTAEIVVHVDAATLPAEEVRERCELADGPVIAPELARRLGCDGSLRTIVERDGKPLAVGRRTRAINPALRHALASRDGGCRFPGCTHTRHLHAHHIEHWARGGSTELSNLVQLCSAHHQLVHEGGFRVEPDGRGGLAFYNRHGLRIPSSGPVGRARSAPSAVPDENRRQGAHIDADTARPWNAGDRLDYDIAVDGLIRKWPGPGAQ